MKLEKATNDFQIGLQVLNSNILSNIIIEGLRYFSSIKIQLMKGGT